MQPKKKPKFKPEVLTRSQHPKAAPSDPDLSGHHQFLSSMQLQQIRMRAKVRVMRRVRAKQCGIHVSRGHV